MWKSSFRSLATATAIFVAMAGQAVFAEPLRGAGSTFASPVIGKWSESYRAFRMDGGDFFSPDFTVDYEPVGSSAGMFRLEQPEMDFAASDAPLPSAELRKRGLLQFPIVFGGIVPVFNLPGVPQGALRVTGPLLADIFLGKISKWNDPALVAINPEIKLPDIPVVAVHRVDGSGSTLNFTTYLAAQSEEWKSKVGADTTVKWPVGSGREGSGRLTRAVQDTPGAIGYVEYGQVVRAALKYALLANHSSTYVAPSPESFRAAAGAVEWKSGEDFSVLLVNSASPRAWPLTVVTYALVREKPVSVPRHRNTITLFALALEKGSQDALALGYAPLDEALVKQVKAYWSGHAKY